MIALFGLCSPQDIPRFGIDRTIRLVPADAQRIYESDQPFKLSFSFDHDRFLSTWITVNDGAGNYLHYIEFEFVYSGDHIQQLKWSVAYQVPDRKGVKPEHIFLRYRWVPFVETDAALGLDTLFLVASLTAWGVILMVLFRMDKVKRSDAKEN